MRGQNGDNLRLAGAYAVSQNRYGEFTKCFRETTVSLVDGGEFTKYFREATMTTVLVVDGVRLKIQIALVRGIVSCPCARRPFIPIVYSRLHVRRRYCLASQE